jgi:hypothetical protein
MLPAIAIVILPPTTIAKFSYLKSLISKGVMLTRDAALLLTRVTMSMLLVALLMEKGRASFVTQLSRVST